MNFINMKSYSLIFIFFFMMLNSNGQSLIPIEYSDDNQKLLGYVTQNSSKKNLPGVLILPAWKGIDNEAKNAAIELEKLGYIAFIADIYGVGNIPDDNSAAAEIAGKYKSDYKAYQRRIHLAINELQNQGAILDNIAVIGYCFGGTGALEVARAKFNVKGVVSIHGGLTKSSDREILSMRTKVLVQHPAEDKSVSINDYLNFEQELKHANADYQIITYANSGHTFTNPESAEYNELMAKRAWDHLVLFLKEVLQ